MPLLNESEIATLLDPYLSTPAAPSLCSQVAVYLELLMRWNARTNLTSVRDPREIIRRHFGESLFAAQHLPGSARKLLDLGSGAGFPGLPIAILNPDIQVTLAEAHQKKASFLREVVRTLQLPVQIWAARAESLPVASRFETVTLRAVDNMQEAIATSKGLLAPGGCLAILTTRDLAAPSARLLALPGTANGVLSLEMFHVEHSVQPAPRPRNP